MGRSVFMRTRTQIACAIMLAAPGVAVAEWTPGSIDYQFAEFGLTTSQTANSVEGAAPGSFVADNAVPAVPLAERLPQREAAEPGLASLEEPALPGPPDFGGMILRLVLGTTAVLFACVISLVLGKRWLFKNVAAISKRGDRMQLLDTIHLSRRCCVQLIGVESRKLLVGIDASGVRSMVVLDHSFDDELGDFEDESAGSTTETSKPLA